MATGGWGGTFDTRVFAVKIIMARGTDKIQTGFHLRDVGLVGQTAQDAADAVASFATSSFRTLLPQDVSIQGIDAVELVTLEGGSVSPQGVVGSIPATSGEEPLYVTVPVSFKGEKRARYGQGRGLWPMLYGTWREHDTLTTAGAAAFQGVIDAMTSAFMGSSLTHDLKLINLHGVIPPRAATASRPARPEIPPTWYDVTSIRLNTSLSFLRSRKAGHGS